MDKLELVQLPLKCYHKQPELSFLNQNGTIMFDWNLVKNYTDLNCSYRCATRGIDDREVVFGNSTVINLVCTFFRNFS